MSYADAVYTHGKVFTVDENFTIATALAVRDGLVHAVGSDAEIETLIGPDTVVTDLGGKTILPGINDSHLHAIAYGLDTPPLSLDVSFPAVRSIADVRELVREAAAAAEDGEWIIGTGWDDGYLDECLAEAGRTPTRWDLDEVSPEQSRFPAGLLAPHVVGEQRGAHARRGGRDHPPVAAGQPHARR